MINNREAIQYDFTKISSESWSIEHIFPQNPGEFKEFVLETEDVKLLQELIPKSTKELIIEDDESKEPIFKLFKKIQKAKTQCKIENEEGKYLNSILKKNAEDLHRIGNLSLLEKGMNSGLSNHFFDKKRKIIVNKVSLGEFVPYHTYDVFSKLIIETDTSLHMWSKNDIEKHEVYIETQLKGIISYLTT